MSDLNALGIAGGSRGVLEHRDVGGSHAREFSDFRRRRKEVGVRAPSRRRSIATHVQAMADTGCDVGCLGRDVEQVHVGDESGGFRIVEDECHFVATVGRVDGDGDTADEREAKPRVQDLGNIGEEETDAVAVTDAQIAEHGGRRTAAAIEVRVGDPLPGDLHEDLVRIGTGHNLQKFAEGFFPRMAIGDGLQTEDATHN